MEQDFIVPEELKRGVEDERSADSVEALRGQREKKQFTVGMNPSTEAEYVLGQHMLDLRALIGPTSEADDEIKRLRPVLNAFRKGRVVSYDPRTGDPRDQSIRLTGQQIADLHDFFTENASYNNAQISGFVDRLVDEYPDAQPVATSGQRIKEFLMRLGGQERQY